MPEIKCDSCQGRNGGKPGNCNMVGGYQLCDYCHADWEGQRNIKGGSVFVLRLVFITIIVIIGTILLK